MADVQTLYNERSSGQLENSLSNHSYTAVRVNIMIILLVYTYLLYRDIPRSRTHGRPTVRRVSRKQTHTTSRVYTTAAIEIVYYNVFVEKGTYT